MNVSQDRTELKHGALTMSKNFGALIKTHRLALGQSLRVFCKENAIDAGNFSRLERGQYPPPQNRGKLEDYARALGLVDGSVDWFEFFDLAAAERGEIPHDLMSDAEIVEKLPVLFRTIRQKAMDDGKLDELVERIRRS